MRKIRFAIVVVGLGLLGGVLSTGCKENPGATAKCKSAPSSDKCAACCQGQGSYSNSFTTSGGCTCY
jgi:hypothetical protein